jgi:hypothetical protein
MLIFLIAVVIVVVTVAGGVGLAVAFARLDNAVGATHSAMENRDKGYNLALTFGHRILAPADVDVQMKEARKLAARKAAALPRGANMGIGRLGRSTLKTASQALAEDPQTAVKIAAFHGWDGARTGAVASAPVAAAAATPAPAETLELVPGRDYPVIEIGEGMSPAETRAARIANAKAKAAAAKAMKEAGAGLDPAATEAGIEAIAAPVPVASGGEAAAGTGGMAPAAQPTGIPEPEYLEVADDMSPDDKRKARIHNAKARSAYNKALKAAGIDPAGS